MGIEIFVDPDTGVNYLVYHDLINYRAVSGFCPRFNTDGTLYVSKIKDKNEDI